VQIIEGVSQLTMTGNYLSCRLAWAGGVALGAWVAGGISGAHINPAVTLALGAFRGFPPRKIPGYLLAQTLGCMVGALLIYFLYRFGITEYEGSLARTVHGPHATGGLFFTMPLPFVPLATAYVTEAVATGTLLFLVLAFMDQDNWGLRRGSLPVGLFFAILGIGSSLGANTGYALNPARDLGPRLALCFLGYGWDVWTHDRVYWFWGPVLSTVLGGLLGTFLYDVLLYTGEDSWVNQKCDVTETQCADRREESPEHALFLSGEERSGTDAGEPARSA